MDFLLVNSSGKIVVSRKQGEFQKEFLFFEEIKNYPLNRVTERLICVSGKRGRPELSGELFYILVKPIQSEERGSVAGYIVVESMIQGLNYPQNKNLHTYLFSSEGKFQAGLHRRDLPPAADRTMPPGHSAGPATLPGAVGPLADLSFGMMKKLAHPEAEDESLHVLPFLLKNHDGDFVFSAGASISYLDSIVYMEIPAAIIMKPRLLGSLFFILLILLVLLVFLYFMTRLDSLRVYALDANPLTHLPGNNRINEVLQALIKRRADVAVIYVDLDNFKAYNDQYGFSKGDEVITFTAKTITGITKKEKLRFAGTSEETISSLL